MARVVITGVGLASPIGNSLPEVTEALIQGRHGIVARPDWPRNYGLDTALAGEVKGADPPAGVRKKVRGMGRVALLALWATEQAVQDARLSPEEVSHPRVGLAYGSTHGSSSALIDFVTPYLQNRSFRGIPSSSYLKFMSHTCAANLAQYYGIQGRVVPTPAACVSASLAVGAGYEAIKYGLQDTMICGGSEELHHIPAGVFDIMMATSRRYNDSPADSPRPFDVARDGLVIGEGAATLILESLDAALARKAPIHGEVIGFGTNCDGSHLTAPSAEGMAAAMQLALRDAQLSPADIQYINAHATATEVGDIAESHAVARVFGPAVPTSSTKGFTGHTLGACGTLEAAFCLAMMHHGFLAANRNLEHLDPRCAPLAYVCERTPYPDLCCVMTNNFAFGGINTSIILRRFTL